jgi:hypothetical protein
MDASQHKEDVLVLLFVQSTYTVHTFLPANQATMPRSLHHLGPAYYSPIVRRLGHALPTNKWWEFPTA